MKEFLRTVALFSGFSDDEIEFLAKASRERHVSEGAYILRKNDPGSSAFVLKEGAAEILLEKPGAPPVHLSRIGPGEVFGEIALFDGEPRSASVFAQQECSIIEISRDLFLTEIAQRPDVSLKLLAAISKQLRRSENIVSNYADRIYGDVMPRLEVAVSAQLESAKTICEQSKERIASVTELVENKWTLLTRVAITAGMVIGLMAGFGVYNLNATRQDIEERSDRTFKEAESKISASITKINAIKEDAEQIAAKLKVDQRTLNNLKEKNNRIWMGLLWMDKLRHDLRLDEGAGLEVSGNHELNNVGRDFLMAQRRLLNNYFGEPKKWDSEILLEALDLLTEILQRNYLVLAPADWDRVIGGIDQLLRNPPDGWRPGQRLEHSVTTLYLWLEENNGEVASKLEKRMLDILTDPWPHNDEKRQTVLILARLGKNPDIVKRILHEDLKNDQPWPQNDKPWQRSQSAVALIALGDPAGWEQIRNDLGEWRPIEDPHGHVEQHERYPDKEKALAAAIAIAENAGPNSRWAKQHQKTKFSPQALFKELTPNKTTPGSPFPVNETFSANSAFSLVANNIINGLNRQQGRWNVFYWRFACNLVCDLGCNPAWMVEGDRLCGKCYTGLIKAFPDLKKNLSGTIRHCTSGGSVTAAPP